MAHACRSDSNSLQSKEVYVILGEPRAYMPLLLNRAIDAINQS
jgi:hypothetical protein